jgi:hypothetical protein
VAGELEAGTDLVLDLSLDRLIDGVELAELSP